MASVNKDELEALYWRDRLSIPDVAKRLGINYSAARTMLLTNGIPLRSRADGVRGASDKLSATSKGRKRVFTEQWRANISAGKLRIGALTAAGVSAKTGGYVQFTRGQHKHRSVHVVLMEQHIGRRLLPGEVVHHIDHNKHNNELFNLRLMTRSEHSRLHMSEKHGKR
jgi:hypothetical protein